MSTETWTKNYASPEWASNPQEPVYIDVIREGVLISQHELKGKDHFFIGSNDKACIVYKNLCVSKCHAVIQFKNDGTFYLMDLFSTHGTWLGETRLTPGNYTQLKDGNKIVFGSPNSKRLFVLRDSTNVEFSKDIASHLGRSTVMIPSKIVFDQEGKVIQKSDQCNVAKQRELQHSEDMYPEDQEETGQTTIKEYLQHYTDSKTGLLQVHHFRQSVAFSKLTDVQSELFEKISNLQNRLKNFEKNDKLELDTNPQRESVLSEIRILQDRLIYTTTIEQNEKEEVDSPTRLCDFIKDSLNERLFDEEDTFFDRTEEWNQKTLTNKQQNQMSINELKSIQSNEDKGESTTLQNESTLSALGTEEQDTLEAYMKMNEQLLQVSNTKTTFINSEASSDQQSNRRKQLKKPEENSTKAVLKAFDVLSRINVAQEEKRLAKQKLNENTIKQYQKDDEESERNAKKKHSNTT